MEPHSSHPSLLTIISRYHPGSGCRVFVRWEGLLLVWFDFYLYIHREHFPPRVSTSQLERFPPSRRLVWLPGHLGGKQNRHCGVGSSSALCSHFFCAGPSPSSTGRSPGDRRGGGKVQPQSECWAVV